MVLVVEGIIFESADYHNAVFIGKDEVGKPKYAACHGTIGSFKRDASSSDKRYSFRLLAKEPTDSVHLFEAAIDLLSYATYLKCEGKDYKSENLLSKTIFLHLDKDKAGRLCSKNGAIS